METLVLPAQDQFARQREEQNQRLAGAGYYAQRKHERQRRNAMARTAMQHERNSKSYGCERGSPSDSLLQNEKSCSFSSVLPDEKIFFPPSAPIIPSCPSSPGFHEGPTAPAGRRWHSMPCSLSGEGNASLIQAKEQGFGFQPHHRPTKQESGRNSRSDTKNRTPSSCTLNKRRNGCDWKPVETGAHNCRPVSIPKQRNPERKPSYVSHEMNMGNEASSPPASPTENWAGPAYSNSPPPSSLPLPKFSMRQRRSVSLELPSASNEFSEALIAEALWAASRSVPASPSGEAPVVLQGFVSDVASATKDLKRILHLDLGD